MAGVFRGEGPWRRVDGGIATSGYHAQLADARRGEIHLRRAGPGGRSISFRSRERNPRRAFEIREDLVSKIKSAAHAPWPPANSFARKAPGRVAPALNVSVPSLSGQIHTLPGIVAIGTSTGGPKALQEVLAQLPAQLPTGILVVQHMPVGFTAQFADRLNHLCQGAVHEAQGEETIEPGTRSASRQQGCT